jgi:hypothetical protein
MLLDKDLMPDFSTLVPPIELSAWTHLSVAVLPNFPVLHLSGRRIADLID